MTPRGGEGGGSSDPILGKWAYRWMDGKEYDYRGKGNMVVSRDAPGILRIDTILKREQSGF